MSYRAGSLKDLGSFFIVTIVGSKVPDISNITPSIITYTSSRSIDPEFF